VKGNAFLFKKKYLALYRIGDLIKEIAKGFLGHQVEIALLCGTMRSELR